MQLTGILFGALAAAWLLYLIPWFANSRGSLENVTTDTDEPQPDVLVRPAVVEVSTPVLRQELLDEIRRLDQDAARRRRIVLFVLLFSLVAVLTAAGFELLPWWVSGIPAVFLAGFLGLARVTVATMRAGFMARIAASDLHDNEDTVCLDLTNKLPGDSLDLAPPAISPGSLWEPIPITKPTYVSALIGPRTVRTINLGGPIPLGPKPLTGEESVAV